MPTSIPPAKEIIETIALDIVMMEEIDPNLLDDIKGRLERLENSAPDAEQPFFSNLIAGLKTYIQRLIAEATSDLNPFEQGINQLQQLIELPGPPPKELSALLDELNGVMSAEQPSSPVALRPAPPNSTVEEERDEIIVDFILESLDNLERVEVHLIDLEESPNHIEVINLIFRIFHTIKGVSSFLKLNHIHQLAHHAENLFEKARDQEIRIDKPFIDLVLETVDGLRRLFDEIHAGPPNQTSGTADLNLEELVERIEMVAEVSEGSSTRQPPQAAEAPLQGECLTEKKSINSGDKLSEPINSFDHPVESSQVKVDTKKLDSLVDLTGELVITQAMLHQSLPPSARDDKVLNHRLEQLSRITSGLQTAAMSMRMIPIRVTFQKMRRIVRDLSKKTAKQVRLTMSGEETELDRNIVEQLYEPTVHMIRNAVDHGIELPSERTAAGKTATGEIHLEAFHQGSQFVIVIRDDGRGLDKDGIVEKAVAEGLINRENHLSDSDIFSLIFHPGLTTSRQVTEVSGRGVGMDVVKKCIDSLKGRIDISSLPGRGTTVEIRLPLTLAILEGMLVRIGSERFIIPTISIRTSFRPSKKDCTTVNGKGEMILSRGRLIPLVRLSRIFSIEDSATAPWQALVVEAQWEGHSMGLLLDELIGKEEVVIKSLGEIFQDVAGIAGGAILGDGRVGLILDMAGIWKIIK